MSSNGKKISKVIPAIEKISRQQLFMGNTIPLLTVIINREHLNNIRFNEEVKTCEDYCLWLEILKEVPFAHGIDSDLARYRNVKDSASNRPIGCAVGVMHIYFVLESESFFLSLSRFFQYAMNGVVKRVKFPINVENRLTTSSKELFPSMANSSK